MSIDDVALSALSKFKKDELYSFLAGLLLAMIYLLCALTISTNPNEFKFRVTSSYYLSLYLLASWLVATFVNYILYQALTLSALSLYACKYSKEYPSGLDIDVYPIIHWESFQDLMQEGVHVNGLMTSVLLLLIPYPLVLFSMHQIVACSASWAIVLGILVFLIALIPAARAKNLGYQCYITERAIAEYRRRVTFNKNEWAANHNGIVMGIAAAQNSPPPSVPNQPPTGNHP